MGCEHKNTRHVGFNRAHREILEWCADCGAYHSGTYSWELPRDAQKPEETLKRVIIVTAQREGFHAWKGAPEEVAFLRNTHRHVFHVRVGLPVSHNDRELEFFIVKKQLTALLADLIPEGGVTGSCEQIAENILARLPRSRWCEVFEDNENGARVEF